MLVKFMPKNITTKIISEETLLTLAARNEIAMDSSCGGMGRCGKCKVKILSGMSGQLDEIEKMILSDWEQKEGYRLACKVDLNSSFQEELVVEVLSEDFQGSRKKNMTILPKNFIASQCIKSYFIKVVDASLEDQSSDLDRIFHHFSSSDFSIEPNLLPQVHELLKNNDGMITVICNHNNIIDMNGQNQTNHCFGVAFDIGTTTVVGMLWNLESNELIDVEARTNPQSAFGADVISRIHSCSLDTSNLTALQENIIQCLNEIIEELSERNQISKNNIYDSVIVGNTTMSHLLLGVNPKGLARAPFAPVFCDSINMKASQLGIGICKNANVHILPNIAGHVGSDIVGVLLASKLKEKKGANLAIDIGTNGEILLAKDGNILACSTAAGPAFEGASIYQGMRAAKGAIEKVKIMNGDVKLDVIDAVEPMGICGSGLIDAVAQLISIGIVDKKGRMLDRDEAESLGINLELTKRIKRNDLGTYFILFWKENGDEIVLTQKDIREVQLAKGAIGAGIKIMMDHLDIKEDDLDNIYLAGAFGNYISIDSALKIGLFPSVEPSKIIPIGNAAGAGACMALLSEEEKVRTHTLAKEVLHFELSTHSTFQNEFLKAMYFPK